MLKIAGYLLIASFIFMLIEPLVGPPRLFQEPELNKRLSIISDYPGRWLAANALFAASAISAAIGLWIFSKQIAGGGPINLAMIAGLVFIVGAIAMVGQAYLNQSQPDTYFERVTLVTYLAFWGISIGLFLFGVVILQSSYSNWLGFSFIGIMTALSVLSLLYRDQFFYNLPPQIFFVLTMILGIVLLRK